MGYDLETINQAWFIACEECMGNKPDTTSTKDMFLYILSYCQFHPNSLLSNAADELNERDNNKLMG